MTRGKHAAGTNIRLREQLHEAEAARRRLEFRIHEAERERDTAVAWRTKTEAEGLPGVLAEQARADAAVAAIEEARLEERARWQALISATRGAIKDLLRNAPSDMRIDMTAWEAFATMYGDTLGSALSQSRQGRRATRTAGQFRAAAERFDIIEEHS